MDHILKDVREYIETRGCKGWTPGKDWVHYAGPYFSADEYVSAVETVLKDWLVLGEKGIKFEREFPKYLGKSYGLLTNSGSSSNLLMMSTMTSKRGFNCSPDDTIVICPVAGFPTTVNPAIQYGFEVRFVDIELQTLNLDLNQLKDEIDNAILNHYKNIIITFAHVLGNPPNMDDLMNIISNAKKHANVYLLEDCCDALGSTWNGQPLGSFGDLASCSFYPAHHITMGEGGFVACNNLETERIIRSFRDWGRDCYCVGKANLSKEGSCGQRFCNWLPQMPDSIMDHKYVYSEIGYNLKPIEIQAAMGLEQLKKLNRIRGERIANYYSLNEIFKKYDEFFSRVSPLFGSNHPGANPSWFGYPLTVKDNTPFTRGDICQFLEEHKIQTRMYFGGNLLLQPAYQDLASGNNNDFPNATKVTKDTFFLGTSPVISKEQIDYIDTVVENFFKSSNII